MLSYKTIKVSSNQMKTLLKYTQCYRKWEIATILKISLAMLIALICSFHIRKKNLSRLISMSNSLLKHKKVLLFKKKKKHIVTGNEKWLPYNIK